MRIIYLSLLYVMLILYLPDILWAESKAGKDAISAAGKWLLLLDNGNYSKSWEDASHYFKENISKEDWKASLSRYRKPLGKAINRKVKTTREPESVSSDPVKKLVIMKFETLFESNKIVFETVAIVKEKDGKWRSAGYFIRKSKIPVI